jgi:uncharacterized protein (DUF488 family)
VEAPSQKDRMAVLTIGYGSRDPNSFGDLIKSFDPEYLLDVRSRPYSRYQPLYGRERLSKLLGAVGVRYVFFGDTLGGQPPEPEVYLNGRVDYTRVRETPRFQHGISRVYRGWSSACRLLLMCSEQRPENCHRSKLITPALLELGVPVQHISESGELLGQDAVMQRIVGKQLSVFGDISQSAELSRKKYRPEG